MPYRALKGEKHGKKSKHMQEQFLRMYIAQFYRCSEQTANAKRTSKNIFFLELYSINSIKFTKI